MSYNVTLKDIIVSTLENRVLTIVDSIIKLTSEGYKINNNKIVNFNVSLLLINAFENIEIFNENQQENLEIIFNKIK